MGRRKLVIKRIEDKSARQVTFTKRRNGLIKKAKELAVLCDVDVNVIIFSSRGKLYHYCSSNSLADILRRYHSPVEAEPSASAEEHYSNYASCLSIGELLHIVERDLRGPDIDNLSITDLVHLEEQLQAALIGARSTKSGMLTWCLFGQEKELIEDNRLLEEKLNRIAENTIDVGANEKMDFNNAARGQMIPGDQQHGLLDLFQSN
ncbi:truncated transcription factor CAULIFLOWER D-like isoform X10 [Olea europaea var. sylvestris]|uniref:truncated transcription factor CAULIFLOWER D-like isoform X10 n=1 Tax=Olea europaea var. sylvestris TaxID=158386 RepID=UPI000C1CCCAE|nr:truncated transcription factor CAULIFLOWER D-like isoform X10 [Olea europaea var. sylvestris]